MLTIGEAQRVFNQLVGKANAYGKLALELQDTHPIVAKRYEKHAGIIMRELWEVNQTYRQKFGYDLSKSQAC